MTKKFEPVDFPVFLVGLLEHLNVVLLHEDPVGVQGLDRKISTFSKLNDPMSPVDYGSNWEKLR
jgi:hypothetical protein